MSQETSPSSHRPYGLARVTRVWQVPRSTVYARRERRDHPTLAAKRGPKPPQSDAELTAAIQAVIAASPFHGEGHRKIWARLRARGLRTSKRRTLSLMRDTIVRNRRCGVTVRRRWAWPVSRPS